MQSREPFFALLERAGGFERGALSHTACASGSQIIALIRLPEGVSPAIIATPGYEWNRAGTRERRLPIAWFVFEKSKQFASLAALEASPADVLLSSAGGDLEVAICN